MEKTPLYNKKENTPMKVGILMSGSGTNAEKIIEFEKNNSVCSYKVSFIFTDNKAGRAEKIGKKHKIPVEFLNIDRFFKKHPNLKRYDIKDREEYDKRIIEKISSYDPDVLAYAGYMNLTTKVLINKYLGINVHPADLSIKNKKGKRKYTGDKAVKDAILAGEETIASSTHIVTKKVDQGAILMISEPIPVKIPENLDPEKNTQKIAKKNQERLKKKGDWVIFPKTLNLIAEQKIIRDKSGNLFFENRPIPEGLKL